MHAKNEIQTYTTFISNTGGVLEGRVIKNRHRHAIKTTDQWKRNLYRSLRTIINKEHKYIKVIVHYETHTFTTSTDDEGYFKVILPPSQNKSGWHTLTVKALNNQTKQQYLVIPHIDQDLIGVISDIDDTILESEVSKKLKLIKNTFLKNASQRKTTQHAALTYQQIQKRQSDMPFFYLSATPRQLYTTLTLILSRNAFPQGIVFTRRLTMDNKRDSFNIRKYKTEKIRYILEQLPHVKFMLIGDDSEHDPEIYQAIQSLFPNQIADIWIRRTSEKPLSYKNHKDFDELLHQSVAQSTQTN